MMRSYLWCLSREFLWWDSWNNSQPLPLEVAVCQCQWHSEFLFLFSFVDCPSSHHPSVIAQQLYHQTIPIVAAVWPYKLVLFQQFTVLDLLDSWTITFSAGENFHWLIWHFLCSFPVIISPTNCISKLLQWLTYWLNKVEILFSFPCTFVYLVMQTLKELEGEPLQDKIWELETLPWRSLYPLSFQMILCMNITWYALSIVMGICWLNQLCFFSLPSHLAC